MSRRPFSSVSTIGSETSLVGPCDCGVLTRVQLPSTVSSPRTYLIALQKFVISLPWKAIAVELRGSHDFSIEVAEMFWLKTTLRRAESRKAVERVR